MLAAGQAHIASPTCWCRPRAHSTDDGEISWGHRHVVLLPDNQPRAFQSVFAPPPV